ncbi:hypothetical protein M5D96_008063, partial [Drosophila gunungcola]
TTIGGIEDRGSGSGGGGAFSIPRWSEERGAWSVEQRRSRRSGAVEQWSSGGVQLGEEEESWLQHYMDRRNGGDPLAPPRPPNTASSTTGISSGSVSGSSSSFTRRRPPAPAPLLVSNNSSSLNNNFLSHFQSAEPASNALGQPPASPPPRLGLGLGLNQPIITKQPGVAAQKEHMHALEELLQNGGGVSGSGGPLVMAGDPSLLNPNPITCLCSAESVIDYASCLCCAKALFYHCARDNDLDCDDGNGTPCVDNPCSCGPYKRTQRWGWLGALSIFLPCLWFYWPMRGCMKLMLPIVPLAINGSNLGGNGVSLSGGATDGGLGQTNGKAMEHGCSAARSILRKGDLTPEKRLLDSSI